MFLCGEAHKLTIDLDSPVHAPALHTETDVDAAVHIHVDIVGTHMEIVCKNIGANNVAHLMPRR